MFDVNDYMARRYFSPLLNPRLNKRESIYSLKIHCPFPELCTITDRISSPANIVYKYIHGNPLPKTYEELGELNKAERIPAADDIISEINWNIISIRKYRKEIQLFLSYRKLYEDAFLLGQYDLADVILKKIESEVCFSIWSLEKRLLLLEISKSPEEHKSFLSEFNKKSRGFFTPTLANYISNRCEKNFSVAKYNADIFSVLASLQGSLGEANRQFYYLRLNQFEFNNYSEYCDILSFESYHSIIDRYITLLKIFKLISIEKVLDTEISLFCVSRLFYLIKKFDDLELLNLYSAFQPDKIKTDKDEGFNMKIFDFYTSGLYLEAIEEMKIQLTKFPSRFEYYSLYVKSFLLSGVPFQLPNENTSIQNTLLSEIHNQLSRKVDPVSSSTNLIRIFKNLSSFSISEGIFYFINSEIRINSNWTRFNYLSLSFNNPMFSKFFSDSKKRNKFLSQVSERYPNSITVNFYLTKDKDNLEESFESLNLPERTKRIELAKYYQDINEFSEAIGLWEKLIVDSHEFAPIYETSIRNLFNCYVKTNQLDRAISLFVNSFIENQYIVQKINCEDLLVEIRKNKFRKISATIDLPLFYTLCNADENEIHIAYEIFNQSQGVEKPSLLFPKIESFAKNKAILFLQLTCTTEIFKHSIFINGSKEGYSERIAVCRQLISLDKENEQIYRQELNSLTEILIIQEGLQQLDESKIYVNEQGLINSELKEFEGLYDTYKTFAKIFKDGSKRLVIFAKEGIIATLDVGDTKSSIDNRSKFSSHPLKDVFQEVFEIITDKFLHSKFGISAYLSTRIRHGVLLGEVRPIFERFNLIAQKDNAVDKYRDIQYWNNRYHYLSSTQLLVLQEELAKLSEVIDTLISDLIKQNLQIKTNKENPEGWFDYYFDDTTLILYSIKLNAALNYQEFVKSVLEILWFRTDSNLEKIRSRIQGEVKNNFNDALSNFAGELKRKLPHTNIPDIYTNITTCSTEVQNAVDRIASWFNRSGSQTSDFTIEKVINIVLENINHSYQYKNIELRKNIKIDPTIRGEFYSHFADLFRIFFDNAVKHSISSVPTIPIEINVAQKDRYLEIEIANEFPDLENIKSLPKIGKQKLNTKKLSTEGKSGIHKAFKIMQDDLKNETNECDLFVDANGRFVATLKIVIDNLTV